MADKLRKAYKKTPLHQEIREPGLIHIDNVYVDQEIILKTPESSSLALEKLFDKKNDEISSSILIQGAPFIGKTSLCWKLVKDWCDNGDYIKSKFKLVFLIDYENLQFSSSFAEYFLERFQDKDLSSNDILRCITKYQRQILLILDGYDRINQDGRSKLYPLVMKREFPSMSFLITCRREMSNLRNAMDNQRFFNKTVEVKGIQEAKLGDLFLPHLGDHLIKVLNEICEMLKCFKMNEEILNPRILVLVALLVRDGSGKNLNSVTNIFKTLLNFMIKRILVFEGVLKTESEVDIFSPSSNRLMTLNFSPVLNQVGMLCLENFNLEFLSFPVSIVNTEEERIFWKLEMFKKKTSDENNTYELMDLIFAEFLAALYTYNKFKNSRVIEDLKKEIKIKAEKDLISILNSYYYVFLGGLLNSRASLLFEVLLPYARTFNLENICFHKILFEIEDSHTFLSSFEPMLPFFIPYTYNTEFNSTPIYSLVLNHGKYKNLIQRFLHLELDKLSEFHGNLTIKHLLITVTHEGVKEGVTCEIAFLLCETLSLRFADAFRIEYWHRAVDFFEWISTKEINLIFDKDIRYFYNRNNLDRQTLNSQLMSSLHKELMEGQWKNKKIDCLKLKILDTDHPNCLRLLIDLVMNKKIKKGIYIEIANSNRCQLEKEEMKNSVEELFHSIVNSDIIIDFSFTNEDQSISPVLDFNRFRREKDVRWNSFYFSGYITLLKGKLNLSVEEVTLPLYGKNEEDSDFLSTFQGIKYLCSEANCFNLLTNNACKGMEQIEELFLIDFDKKFHFGHCISQLLNLQVLSLKCSSISYSLEFGNNLAQLLFRLNLRILEMIDINDKYSFNFLIDSLQRGLGMKKVKREQAGLRLNEDEFFLQDLYIDSYFLFDVVTESHSNDGIKGIRTMLLSKQLKRCCWVAYHYAFSINNELFFLFDVSNGFVINVEVDGMDPWSSRRSQISYRWFNINPKYCISTV